MAQSALDFLASLEFFGIKLGLDQTRELFRRLGNPERNLKFIHVAGSNGKGSTCAFLESALRHAGFRTGFYSSPHLVHPAERFRLNGLPVSEEKLTKAIEKVIPVVHTMEQDGMKVTYFEAGTVIAAMLFADFHADYVIWEVGMGGRLDSTNIVTPLVSVITGISMEHSERLGDTLGKIAFEKAGIIKPGLPVFCAQMTPEEAKAVIRARADELHSPYYLSADPDQSRPVRISMREDGRAAVQSFRLADGTELAIPLMGPHQRSNAELAYAVLNYLAGKEGFDLKKALTGFPVTRWPGRFQFQPEKRLILDSAHNPEGAEVLSQTLRELFPEEKFHFIFGAFSDKDTAQGLAMLAPLAKSFRFLTMDTMRSCKSIEQLSAELDRIDPAIPRDAGTLKETLAGLPAGDGTRTILCGSLHLCGDALGILNGRDCQKC